MIVHQHHFFAVDAPRPLLANQMVLVAAKKHVLAALFQLVNVAGPTGVNDHFVAALPIGAEHAVGDGVRGSGQGLGGDGQA